MENWRFKKEVGKQLGMEVPINKGYRERLMSRSASLFKIKKFELVGSQQVLDIKRMWQETAGDGVSDYQYVHLTLAFLEAQEQMEFSLNT